MGKTDLCFYLFLFKAFESSRANEQNCNMRLAVFLRWLLKYMQPYMSCLKYAGLWYADMCEQTTHFYWCDCVLDGYTLSEDRLAVYPFYVWTLCVSVCILQCEHAYQFSPSTISICLFSWVVSTPLKKKRPLLLWSTSCTDRGLFTLLINTSLPCPFINADFVKKHKPNK